MQIVLLILCIILCMIAVFQTILIYKLINAVKANQKQDLQKELSRLETSLNASQQVSGQAFEKMAVLLREEQKQAFDTQEEKIGFISRQTTQYLSDARQASELLSRQTEERMRSFSLENAQKLNQIESAVQKHLSEMRAEQNHQLDEMRRVVDEKMQKVLNERMNQAFSTVNERLEQVHRGLGEMQNLAGSVGDLKKLLTNVKTRGEIGEIQLETLLADILSETQYLTNAKLGSGFVEFAVRIPDMQDGETLLPIDAKFPADTYQHLLDAYETGDKKAIQSAQKALAERIRSEAQDIQQKYITPPVTTDFAVLFLPTEGLYTEAVRAGLTEEIFRKYRVFVTSPSTLCAMLMTLQTGFRSVAVQKRSTEVWQILGEVRTEFHKFADALAKTQDKISSAGEELEKLVGVRTRQMNRKLNNVQNYLTENSSEYDNQNNN
ncbi:MAG: DNA recombination protein RmuC [Oscillospiraceae bacterium]|nr:DNA recombination protein RmuC [Oscillospiraceae bacterium]